MRNRRFVVLFVVAALLMSALQAATAATTPDETNGSTHDLTDSRSQLDVDSPGYALDLDLVADGLVQPTDIVDPLDGSGRLFVVERQGRVRVIQDGILLDEPFLDISDRVATESWEQGMLGIAFHPEYETNGEFFITFSPTSDEWRMERWVVSADPNVADPATAETVLSISHPGDTHYGGNMIFGSDGYLWVSVGDGGGAHNPFGTAQDLGSLLGKLLRIDVDAGDPYAIPADNPFVDTPDARPEIWAYGLRNPWRFSFDRLTGDLYLGDVGETTWEEVNFEPADSAGGVNYGWPAMEGMECSAVAPDCDPSLYTLPIAQHDRANGCSVTGGYVYRADPESALYGTYVYADFCNGTIWTAVQDSNGWSSGVRLRTPLSISSFGEDSSGNLYVTDFTRGAIYVLFPYAAPSQADALPNVLRTDPGSLPAGGASCAVTIRGWSFAPDARVLVNDAPHDATFLDTTWITLQLSSDETAQPGTLSIVVENGDGQRSDAHDLLVDDRGGSNGAISDRWARDDLPVHDGTVSRTWMWGSGGMTCPMSEDYADTATGQRLVQYFDKSRMEVTNPDGDPDSVWYVTNGLLATELISGNLQLGDDLFEQRTPAEINVAGDSNDATGPTYSTFSSVRGYQPLPVGTTLTQRIDRTGTIWDDGALAQFAATAAHLDEVTNHTIASPFWEYMNSLGTVYEGGQYFDEPLFENPFYATGRPITEAYWATVKVGGVDHEVLMQCFERRCLTFTPGNVEGWQVEAGNVGQHYYRWRYGQ